jgi:hypothetical protein
MNDQVRAHLERVFFWRVCCQPAIKNPFSPSIDPFFHSDTHILSFSAANGCRRDADLSPIEIPRARPSLSGEIKPDILSGDSVLTREQ